MSVIKERIHLKPLSEYLKSKEKNDLLFTGMKEKPSLLPSKHIEEQRQFYREVVKPTVERTFNRHINK